MTDPQTPDNSTGPSAATFIDTPVLQARRQAFDSPTQKNLNILIDAVRQELLGEVTRLTQERDAALALLFGANDERPASLAEGIRLLELTLNAEHERAEQAEADLLLCQQEKEEAESKLAGLTHAMTDLQATYEQGIAPVVEAMRTSYIPMIDQWAETLARLLTQTEQQANEQEDDSRSFGTHVREAIDSLREKGPA